MLLGAPHTAGKMVKLEGGEKKLRYHSADEPEKSIDDKISPPPMVKKPASLGRKRISCMVPHFIVLTWTTRKLWHQQSSCRTNCQLQRPESRSLSVASVRQISD